MAVTIVGYTQYGSFVLETGSGKRLYLSLPLCADYAEALNSYLKAIGEPKIPLLSSRKE